MTSASHPEWLTSGYNHVWLPYTQMHTAELPLPVKAVEGCHIILEDGTTLIDGISSWWSVCHGHNHPHLREALIKQSETLPHVMFAGLAHEPAYKLAQRLCLMAPEGLTRCFFSDSGSTSVEVALKMALQYWRNKGEQKKIKFICFEHGYHGDTFGAMSVAGRGGMHSPFEPLLAKQYVLPIPRGEYGFAEFSATVAGIADSVAGLIIEPLVQGAGGMRFHSADILSEIRRICREHDILFIADEIMTGFGRTGTMFSCEEAGISPDILCVGKGLTGGMMTLAATLATNAIFNAFLDDDISKALMHGPTFMGNPLACAVANASLDLFENEPRLAQAEKIEKQLRTELANLTQLEGVKEVRVRGAIGVVQLLNCTMNDMFAMRPKLLKHNVWLRPFNDVIYIMPPLVIQPEQLSQLTAAVTEVITKWSSATC